MEELSKQINLYSVDTKAFYTLNERNYSSIKSWSNARLNNIKKNLRVQSHKFVVDNRLDLEKSIKQKIELELIEGGYTKNKIKLILKTYDVKDELKKIENQKYKELIKTHKHYIKYKKILDVAKDKFNEEINNFTGVRKLNQYYLNARNKVSLFDSDLTRTMKFKISETTNDLLIIRPYHYIILKQLIKSGYNYKHNHYILYSASAGQIRTKKCVFINERLYKRKEKTLMCGLTREIINKSNQAGMNLTKFMAYTSLYSSATVPWCDFDIDRCIVIKDFETKVNSWVDYIDIAKLENAETIEECIDRRKMEVPIPHSDGCGWILPTLSKKNFMVRLPWIKGLLTPCDYIDFCKTERKVTNEKDRYKIIDFWGNEHDLIKENIQVIFTESQFKAIKYYKNWKNYKKKFKKFNCHANKCNIEVDTKDFRQASINYQMLQTITDISDEEIKYFTQPVEEYLTKGYTNLDTQLDILGVNRYYKTNLQKALKVYPEMVQESYVKEMLNDTLNKKKKQAKYGKFKINAKYTFAIPDVYAWMEFVFNNDSNPKGALTHGGTVSCRLFKEIKHLTVNRSPHLYRELGTRVNVNNKNTKKWFITDGCYTSCHDLLTKLLQNDNDGDKYLVIADETYYNIAKRNMKGIVPLYYEMHKAKPQQINNDTLYTALTEGYKYGNVGQYSNKITVMFNEDKVDLNAIKILTALNNFYIDGAKTGYMPKMSKAIKERIKKANGKLPYFFIFAKDKNKEQVKPINKSTVNKICKNIENIPIQKFEFKHHGSFRKEVLIHNKNIEVNDELIKYYLKLDKEKNAKYFSSELNKSELYNSINNDFRKDMIEKAKELDIDYSDMIDMIIKHVYDKRKNLKKTALWDIFGEQIIDNINNNLRYSLNDKNVKMCTECGKRFMQNSKKPQLYCEKCARKIDNRNRNNRKR